MSHLFLRKNSKLRKTAAGFTATMLLAMLIPMSFLSAPKAEAAVSTETAASTLLFNPRIKAASATTSVMGLNLVTPDSDTLTRVRFTLSGESSFALASDLEALSAAGTSGLALYKDNKAAGSTGQFDIAVDTPVALSVAPVVTQVNRLSKITPTVTALVTDTTMTLTAGDVVFSDSTANPTDLFYGWHIVTTGNSGSGGVASTALRLNASESAPTFAEGSRLSKLSPAGTVLANGATGGGILAVDIGDFVFGKHAAASGYSWHIVTTAGNLSDNIGENTALLSGTANDPAIAANTQLSKFSPGATATDNGDTDGGVLAVALGDMTFVKIGPAYGWHIVTTAGNLSSGADENTAYLDGASSDPGIAANSQMSSFAGAGGTFQVTTALTTDTDLVIAAGDIAFGQVTRNPATFSAPGWMLATTGATGVSSTSLRLNGSAAAPSFGWVVVMTLATPQVLSANNAGANAGNDYFITVKTASGATNGRAFRAGMNRADLTFGSAGTPQGSPAAVMTDPITIDTTAPTINAGATGPSDGATGVPISSFINVGFSENIDPSSVGPNTVTLTTGGNPVGIGFKSRPDGFNVIISNPPTYTASSRFAKLSGTGFGQYQMFGSNTIFPQAGTYLAPTAGDIVYTQHDTFPMELGLVTNATLTSGTFAVNGQALLGDYSIVKVADPTVTGAVSGSSVIGIGDLLVVNTSANPTTSRYAWHIASTSAAINSADLRLDDSASAPTFVSGSSFSRLMPTATSTVAVDSTLTEGLNLVLGDIVFAKVSTNADNTGSYAWHLVTTAEEIAAEGSPSTLRLDSAGSAPVFAPNTVIAKLSTSATGLSDNSDDADTSFNYGDIIFAKTTANASANDSYNFHLISNGGTGADDTALRLDNSSANLTTSSTYILTVTTGVTDSGGNPIASNQTITFATGSTGGTNTTPPFVTATTPTNGSQSHPTGAPIKVQFSQSMATSGDGSVTSSVNVGLFLEANGTVDAAVSATNTYDSDSKTVTITPASALTANTGYIIKVATSAKSTTDAPAQSYQAFIRTSAGTDSVKPTVTGVYPGNASTGAERGLNAISLGFSEDMDPSSITSSSVTLSGGVTGSVSYDTRSRTAFFAPTQLLDDSTEYTVTVTSSATDVSGNALDQDGAGGGNNNFTSTFTTSAASDSTAPGVDIAAADDFSVSVTFTEAMKSGGGPNAADNIANYSLESPVGSSISLGGKSVSYDGATKSAKISGLSLQNGNTFKVTVSAAAQDLSANALSTAGSPAANIAQGTVQNASATGGEIGPGSGQQQSAADQGMNPVRVMPMSRLAGAKSNYTVEFATDTTVPAGGTIVLTFPTGFDASAAAARSATETLRNADINGPASGTVTIASVTGSSNRVTLTTAGAATGAGSFVSFELKDIVNTTVPSDAGYTVDIKTKNDSGVLLDSKTSGAFYLGATGAHTLTVNAFEDDGAGGGTAGNNVRDGSEAAIASAKFFLFSPASGGLATTTNASGVATFPNLSSGDYMLMLEPSSVSFSANSAPQPITISGNTTKNFGLGSSGSSLTIAGSITGPNGTDVDIFASSPFGFTKKKLSMDGNPVNYTLPVQANTTYRLGVGPAMPDFIPGSTPPKPPTFTFMPPPEIEVNVAEANVTGKNFTLTGTSKSITGSVLDADGNAVSNAQVFARPNQESNTAKVSSTGMGVGGETTATGAFTLSVVPGVYIVEVFKPGMPHIPAKQINVPSSGNNVPLSLTFKLPAGTGITISGTVKDDSGNAIPYAGVGGRKVTSTSDTTAKGGGANNFVGSPTAADGTYTLYVDAGTWVIEAFAPDVGFLGSKTVTVGASSLSGQDFSGETLSLGSITGTVTKGGTPAQGVGVRAEGDNGKNMAVTDASGNYKLKLPAGTYTVYSTFPGVGEGTPLTGVAVVADTATADQDITLAAPITITVNLTDGTNAITNAFVEARDANGRGNGTNQSSTSGANGVYTLQVAPGTYTIRANHPAYGPVGATTGVNSTRSITYTAAAGDLKTVSGTVTAGGSALSNAWVSLIGTPTGQDRLINLGAITDGDGAYSISAPAGSYVARADKPGYVSPAEKSVTVSGATTVTAIALTASDRTISGSVTLTGSNVAGAFVEAFNGTGGFVSAQTDPTGAYSLAVTDGTWALQARSIGYESAATSVVVSGSNKTQALTLSAISGFTPKSRRQESITPNSGGLLSNTDIGSAFKMSMPANALGTDSTAATVNTQPTSAVPNPPKGSVLAKNAVSISATDSSGSPITSLSSCVTLTVPYTEADLPEGADENDLVMGAWNDSTQNYDTWPTTVDSTNNTLTACVTHFSDFAPLLSSTPTVSSSPSPTPSPTTTGGGGIVSSGFSLRGPSLKVEPSASIAVADSSSATATTVTLPKVVILRATPSGYVFVRGIELGARSVAVKHLQVVLNADPDTHVSATGAGSPGNETELFGPLTKAAVERFQEKHGIAKAGDAGYGYVGPKTRAKLNELASLASTPDISNQQPATSQTPLSIEKRITILTAIASLLEQVKILQVQLDALNQ